MSDLTKVKKIIQDAAWKKFPAQELWFREADLRFWAYEKREDSICITEGNYANDELVYATMEYPTSNVEEFVDDAVVLKEKDGYTCFASQLFN
jgi:hypothetical protein